MACGSSVGPRHICSPQSTVLSVCLSLLSYFALIMSYLLGTLSHLFYEVRAICLSTEGAADSGMVFDCLLPLPLGPGSLGPKTSGPGQFSCPLPSRNGLPIRADGHRVHQSPDGTLLIHNLRAGDQGSYTCSTYRGSQAVSRSTEVKVVPPGRKGRCPRAGCDPRDSGPSPGSFCQFLEV